MSQNNYEKMFGICRYNNFGMQFKLWDILEQYVISGRPLEKMRTDFRFIMDAYKEVVLMETEDGESNTC